MASGSVLTAWAMVAAVLAVAVLGVADRSVAFTVSGRDVSAGETTFDPHAVNMRATSTVLVRLSNGNCPVRCFDGAGNDSVHCCGEVAGDGECTLWDVDVTARLIVPEPSIATFPIGAASAIPVEVVASFALPFTTNLVLHAAELQTLNRVTPVPSKRADPLMIAPPMK